MEAACKVSARSTRFLAMARPYVRHALGGELDGVFVRGLGGLARASAERALICAANHVSMWDPLLLVALEATLPGAGHALMDAANLARLPFFGRVGAVPLDRREHARAMADLERAAELVRSPGERMWIFPQGEQRAAHLRPLGLRAGVLRLAETSGAAIVPVAIQYSFREAPRPACFVSIGEPLAHGAGLVELERAIEGELARIDACLEGREPAFEALIASRVVAPGESVWARWLGRMVGGAS